MRKITGLRVRYDDGTASEVMNGAGTITEHHGERVGEPPLRYTLVSIVTEPSATEPPVVDPLAGEKA